MTIEYRNPVRISDYLIDCEINHEVHGWIPFSCAEADPYTYFNSTDLYNTMLNDEDLIDRRPPPPTEQELYDLEARNVRLYRKSLLAENVDPMVSNELRWNSLSAERQAEWNQYRQALLDITEQAGFPFNVEWPTRPKKK